MDVPEIIRAVNDPVVKLIETVSAAIGKIYDPRYVRKMADAKAYEPDFVVETADTVFIVEIKASTRLNDEEVLLKAKAAYAFCEHVNTTLPDVKKLSYI